jgi:pectin methylesterase-like acyl-CoA thioesterase
VCPDPPLRLTFSSPPTLGTSGTIRVYDAAQPATAVATVDMGASTFSDTIGGTMFNTLRPAYVDGDDAVVYLPSHALTFGKTYYVMVDSGAIVGPGGAAVAVTNATAWRFTTAPAAPSSASTVVALDGSGPYCTVQRALDAVPAGNSAAVTITVAPGAYHEIIHFASKNNVTVLGESRTGTVIEGTNNNNLNPTTSTRSLVGVDNSSGVVFDTLTIQNLTPQGGSQAEALRLQSCDKCILRNANVSSLQDTLLWSGRVYASQCTISGNVDFVWGTGVAYFDQCVIHTVGRAGAIVQARNTASGYGYVFVDSTLTADSGVTGQVLARIDVSQYPASHVAYIHCTMGSFIAPAGWTITGGTDTSQLRFWEYDSVDSAGNAIDVSHRIAGSTQISSTEAASMRDPTVVLGGWQPPAN